MYVWIMYIGSKPEEVERAHKEILERLSGGNKDYPSVAFVATVVNPYSNHRGSIDAEVVAIGPDKRIEPISLPELAYDSLDSFRKHIKENYGMGLSEVVNHSVSQLEPIGLYLFNRQAPEFVD